MEETEDSKPVRTIKGPCFDCNEQCWFGKSGCVKEHIVTMCDCHCDDAEQTAPTPKLDPETRPNVPPLLLVVAALLCLCGCATPQKLITMSRRALVLTKGAEARCKDVKSCAVVTPCAEASARAATESEKALRKQADAVRVTDGARADEADRALRSAERECAK